MQPTSLVLNQETTTLRDGSEGLTVGYTYRPDPTRDNVFSSPNDDLANFFARPIVTNSYTWTPLQGSAFTATINPWTTFFGNKRVINRVNNYALMRANLHVRFLINGNGFYYGRLMADYAPLPTNDDVSSYSTAVWSNAVAASQRMRVFIDPAMSCTCELYLPFVFYKDAISPVSSEWGELGTIYIRELNGLKHANGSVQPLTISVLMWATEVSLAVPTCVGSSALVAQAGEDEYSTSPVSSTATAAAAAADAMSSLPAIGPYAKATSTALGGVAAVAKAFGFSRPATIERPAPMVPVYISDLAPCDAGDRAAKVTVDSKQELSIDPNVIGIDLPDELSIAHIASRESLVTNFAWATTKASGDLLWNAYVTPTLCRYSAPNFYLPACAFASTPFEYWRGKMRFRFQIVASGYHRGRLRFVWDPLYVASLESNVQLTSIVDITETKDVVMEIDWGQTTHYLKTSSWINGANAISTSALTVANTDYFNGVLAVYVLNDLATPNSTVDNTIAVNVYVSCTDMEVAVPEGLNAITTNAYTYVQQAGEDDETPTAEDCGCGPAGPVATMGSDGSDPHDYLVYFGERITSFRQLLKRYAHHCAFVLSNGSATNHGVWIFTLPDFPNYYGYNSASLHTTTTGAYKFNYVHPTLINFLAPAFVASRGSLRTKYVASGASAGDVLSMTLERGYSGLVVPTAVTALPVTSQSNYARAVRSSTLACNKGAITTVSTKQPVLEVELPYYKPVRFDESRTINCTKATTTNPSASSHALEVRLSPGTNTVVLDRFVAAGEDFSFFWFQGCPPLSTLAAPA